MLNEIMIPPRYDQIWKDLVTQKQTVEFSFIAVKILLIRHQLKIKYAGEDINNIIEECADELYNYFIKKAHLPQTQDDLRKINKLRRF